MPFRNATLYPFARLLSICLVATLLPTPAAALTGTALPPFIPTGQAVGPPGSSGDVFGSEELIGLDGNAVNPADSATATDYDLIPGQIADADLGLYLDLEEAENPQRLPKCAIYILSGNTDLFTTFFTSEGP